MSKKETDISQIRKYLNGELDARAMHRLERRAQDDPFLMDALEGYEKVGGDQRANLNEITKRLKHRSAPQIRRIVPWRYMAAAASILIVLTIGGLYVYNHPAENKRLADEEKPATKADTVKAGVITGVKKEDMAAASRMAAPESSKKIPAKTGREVAASRPVIQVVPDKAAARPATNSDIRIRRDTVKPTQYAVVKKNVKVMQEREISSSVAAAPADADRAQENKAVRGRAAGAIADNVLKRSAEKVTGKTIVTGRVIETGHGAPVIGATIIVAGTNVRTHTNTDGYFTIPVDSTKDKLYIANSGYLSRQVSARNKDSLGKIKLEPNTSALSEEAVAGYGAGKKTVDDGAVTKAHPDAGWDSFNNYLKKNAVSSDGSTGVTKVSFNVDANGAISDIIVVKSLNKTADQKAIDLIKNGPAWIGNTNGKPEKVSVRVKFVKAK